MALDKTDGSRRRGMPRLLLLIPLLVACGSAPEAEGPEPVPHLAPRAWESAEAQAALRAAPDPTACAVDDDCRPFHGGGEAPPAVCCNDSTTGVTNRAHVQWVADFRARFCAAAECSPPPVPGALPGDCFFIGRCVEGRCATACEAGPRSLGAGSITAPPESAR